MKILKYILVLLFVCACKSPEARYPVTHTSGSFIKESAERNIRLNKAEQSIITQIIKSQPEHEFLTSENGFWYFYNTKMDQDSIMPKFGDIVNFDYELKDLQGNMIYTRDELKNQTYAVDQQELFTGLRQGIKLMKAGETVTFLFPSQMAYGYYGDENRIGTNVPLMCTVQVNSITQSETN